MEFDNNVIEVCKCQLAVLEIPLRRMNTSISFCNETEEGR
jgi:hypothetical protein